MIPPRSRKPVPGKIDQGIAREVRIMQAAGIETFESCEGGPGHAYLEPTVRFHGTPEAGWRALGVCFSNGLKATCLRRIWNIQESHEPTGPYWEITFKASP